MRLSQNEFRSLLGDFCTYADQPFGVSSGLGVMAVSKAAHAAGVKVLLTGDGADETLGGYSWYQYLDDRRVYHPKMMKTARLSHSATLPYP